MIHARFVFQTGRETHKVEHHTTQQLPRVGDSITYGRYRDQRVYTVTDVRWHLDHKEGLQQVTVTANA